MNSKTFVLSSMDCIRVIAFIFDYDAVAWRTSVNVPIRMMTHDLVPVFVNVTSVAGECFGSHNWQRLVGSDFISLYICHRRHVNHARLPQIDPIISTAHPHLQSHQTGETGRVLARTMRRIARHRRSFRELVQLFNPALPYVVSC